MRSLHTVVMVALLSSLNPYSNGICSMSAFVCSEKGDVFES